ncbi:MAG: hypothetical protein O2782_03865 [bacterium]|nr:hypothetical protein [bacterium]
MTDVRFDPLIFGNGAPVDTAGWTRRRDEMRHAIIPHQYGGMPPMPTTTTAVLRCASSIRDMPVDFHTYEVRCEVGGGEISFTLNLWIPQGDGDRPVVLDGDGCWRYFNDDIIRRIVARGNIAASFDRTALAADNKDNYRDTGLYRLLPEAAFGALSAWAWGYHRCVDVLATIDGVCAEQIAITGHSRGGKAVLLAGATDERIALVNPNDSGTGGCAPNHRKTTRAEVVESFFGSGNIFWFGQDFADHRGRDRELPYEQHYLHALVAPRYLLVTEAYEDPGASPPGSYASCLQALRVYDFLRAPEALAWAFREGGHNHQAEDYEALLALMDRAFHGRAVRRDFQRPLFPDLDRLLPSL